MNELESWLLEKGYSENMVRKQVLRAHERSEDVHLTLPPHIISVQVKSQSMLHHGSVVASLKQNKRKLT